MSWTVPKGTVVALVGPAGGGKSTLLRVLAGAELGASRSGIWRRFGADITGPDSRVHLVEQAARGSAEQSRLEDLLCTSADLLLWDEPLRGRESSYLSALTTYLEGHRRRGATVLVTHHLGLVRAVADDVVLLVDGRLEHARADDFFERPQSELARRFVSQGNCWPEASPPQLPSHFHWLSPGRVAGMGKPGLLNDVEPDLEAIAHAGIGLLVNLTESPPDQDALRAVGIRGRHFPIPDMGVPARGATLRLINEIARALADGQGVAVHCHAGKGRTGTILASLLVGVGVAPKEAIARVRAASTGAIQSAAQERFIHQLADDIRAQGGLGQWEPVLAAALAPIS